MQIKLDKLHFISLLLVFSLCLFTFLPSCKKNIEETGWDVTALLPLANTSMNLSNLFVDSLQQTDDDNLISLVYRTELYELSLDSLMNIPDTSFLYSVNLNSLDLGEIKMTYRTSLGDIANKDLEENGPGGLYDIIMNAHNTGSPAVIDPMDPQTYNDIVIDGTEYFESISLQEGYIDITIDNQLPIAVSDLIFELRNEINNEIILQDTFEIIEPGENTLSTHNLAGTTIYGNLLANAVIASPGSGTAVSIDTNDAITAEIRVYDLVIDSADAVFPNQNIIDLHDSYVLQDERFQLKTAIAQFGNLHMKVVSTLPEDISFQIALPGVTSGASILSIDGNVAGAMEGSSSESNFNVDISGYTFDFSGIGPFEEAQGDLNGNGTIDPDTISSLYYHVTGSIDSSGNIAHITMDDSIYVELTFEDFEPKHIKGYMAEETIHLEGSSQFSGLEQLQETDFQFEEAIVSLITNNPFGVNTVANLQSFHSVNNSTGNTVSLETTGIFPAIIERPDGNEDIINVTPAESIITFNNDNSTITDAINNKPDQIDYTFDFTVGDNILSDENYDFVNFGDTLHSYIDIEIPLSLQASQITFTDTTLLEIKQEDLENIKEGVLYMIIDNYYPMEGSVRASLLDSLGISNTITDPESFFSGGRISNVTGRVNTPKRSIIEIPLEEADIESLMISDKITITIDFSTSPEDEFIKIYNDYTISVKFSAEVVYVVNNE
jgi:hypothetical protein